MKVVSTEALTKLIQLVKSAFIKVDDVVEVTEIETETPSEITLATVATSGSYNDLTNKPTIPTVNNPTITFTQGGTTKGTITLNQTSDQTVAFDAGSSARNIGEIIQSTIPLTDAGLHLLDGALISGDGIYSEFYDFMVGKWQTYPQIFAGEQDWQNHVSTYGVCGKFVLDEANRTIRLPLITGFIEGTNTLADLEKFTQAGVPNITGQVIFGNSGDIGVNTQYVSGAFYTDTGRNIKSASSGSQTNNHPLLLNASRSSSIYGRSSTVQPQSIKVLYYIVVANSTKTDIKVDIDEIVTDLNGKADVDLSNCTKPHITETYVNGTSWYRVYSDGWCEQGGQTTTASQTVTFLKEFNNIPTMTWGYVTQRNSASYDEEILFRSVTAKNFVSGSRLNDAIYPGFMWQACGYIS